MPDRKPHILIDGFVSHEEFRSRRPGRNPIIPPQDRSVHGQSLVHQYSGVLENFENQRAAAAQPITEDIGIYVEVIGAPGCEFPLDSLDTVRDFKLLSCRKVNDHEVAVVFVPESRRDVFHRKLGQYLDPGKDGKGGPRNHNLIDSISEIKLADLRSFWTDDAALYPEDPQQLVWWELWLKKRPTDGDPLQIAHQLAERIDAQLSSTTLSFFESFVVLIKAAAQQLERAPELIANLEELRRAKETPNVLIESSSKDQHEWAADLNGRLQVEEAAATAVTILDTGINYNHPLLGRVCNERQAERWAPTWPLYDDYDPANPLKRYNDHGSRQAGLATFGDFQEALVSADPIVLNHRIESARILPPSGDNDPELYGAITVGTAAKLEVGEPEWSRVYSLAVTSKGEREGGQPSSFGLWTNLFFFIKKSFSFL